MLPLPASLRSRPLQPRPQSQSGSFIVRGQQFCLGRSCEADVCARLKHPASPPPVPVLHLAAPRFRSPSFGFHSHSCTFDSFPPLFPIFYSTPSTLPHTVPRLSISLTLREGESLNTEGAHTSEKLAHTSAKLARSRHHHTDPAATSNPTPLPPPLA